MKSFWVLFSIILFGGLFGVPGMILAVPIFACIYEAISSNVNSRLKKKNKSKKINIKKKELSN
ncbi:MAG: AI-2E family transporter [Bacilli bacterium]|nr:AI-2E family transporter [Bacilli bacterium]